MIVPHGMQEDCLDELQRLWPIRSIRLLRQTWRTAVKDDLEGFLAHLTLSGYGPFQPLGRGSNEEATGCQPKSTNPGKDIVSKICPLLPYKKKRPRYAKHNP